MQAYRLRSVTYAPRTVCKWRFPNLTGLSQRNDGVLHSDCKEAPGDITSTSQVTCKRNTKNVRHKLAIHDNDQNC